jgi:hypothetical protein
MTEVPAQAPFCFVHSLCGVQRPQAHCMAALKSNHQSDSISEVSLLVTVQPNPKQKQSSKAVGRSLEINPVRDCISRKFTTQTICSFLVIALLAVLLVKLGRIVAVNMAVARARDGID